MKILDFFKRIKNKRDKNLSDLVKNSYKSLRVVGRGTIKIDPSEVKESEEFKQALKKAKKIVNR